MAPISARTKLQEPVFSTHSAHRGVDSRSHLRYSLVLAQFRACVPVCSQFSHREAHPEGPSASSLRRSREPKGFSPWEVAPEPLRVATNRVCCLSSTRIYGSKEEEMST